LDHSLLFEGGHIISILPRAIQKKGCDKDLISHPEASIGVFLRNEMIASIVNFIINQKVVLAFYIIHKQGCEDHRPVNMLIYNIIKWSIEKQLQILNFGIFTAKEAPNMGLVRFKENFGASGIFRDTIELNLSKCQ